MVRFKNRYMVFELYWKDRRVDETTDELVLLNAFRNSMQSLFGLHGLSAVLASLQVKYYNPVVGICVVRCSRDDHRKVWAAISSVTEVQTRAVSVRLLELTGAVQVCREFTTRAVQALQAGRQLTPAQFKLMEAGKGKLDTLDI